MSLITYIYAGTCECIRTGLLPCAGASGEAQDAKRARLAEGTQANGRPRSGQPQSPRGGAATAAAAAAANGHGVDLSKGRPKRQVCALFWGWDIAASLA